MPINKPALAASAVASLFAAAGGAHATVVGTNAATAGNSASNFFIKGKVKTQVSSLTLTGTATLDDSGTYTATSSGSVNVSGFPSATILATETFLGTYGSGVFTPTSGSLNITSCSGSPTVCAGATHPDPKPFNTGVGGSVSLASGGTLTGTAFMGAAGTVPSVTSHYSFTVGAFTPVSTSSGGTSSGGTSSGGSTVPLPPAAWLLGSGLLGLVGTARRRRKV
jgi:hypothetical protein